MPGIQRGFSKDPDLNCKINIYVAVREILIGRRNKENLVKKLLQTTIVRFINIINSAPPIWLGEMQADLMEDVRILSEINSNFPDILPGISSQTNSEHVREDFELACQRVRSINTPVRRVPPVVPLTNQNIFQQTYAPRLDSLRDYYQSQVGEINRAYVFVHEPLRGPRGGTELHRACHYPAYRDPEHGVVSMHPVYGLMVFNCFLQDIDTPDYMGQTPLHVALWCRNSLAVEFILQHTAKIERANEIRQTPFHIACWNYIVARPEVRDECANIIRLFLARGVNTNQRDCLGYAPLHIACWYSDADAVGLLLAHEADPNFDFATDPIPPLHIACRLGNSLNNGSLPPRLLEINLLIVNQLLACLLRARTDAFDSGGQTPFHIACRFRNFLVANRLLREPGVNVDSPDRRGWTALHQACYDYNRPPDVIKFLLGSGADPRCEARFVDGLVCTPLDIACYGNYTAAVEYIGPPPKPQPRPTEEARLIIPSPLPAPPLPLSPPLPPASPPARGGGPPPPILDEGVPLIDWRESGPALGFFDSRPVQKETKCCCACLPSCSIL